MLSNKEGTIRSIQPEDLRFLADLRGETNTWMYLGSPDFINEASQRVWYDKVSNDPTKQYMIYQKNHTLPLDNLPCRVGMVRIDEINCTHRSARVGGDIITEFRRRGHATNMYRLIQEYCFDFLNLHRIWLLVVDYNEPAIALYKKVGFKEEGRYIDGFLRAGKYSDYICMSLINRKGD